LQRKNPAGVQNGLIRAIFCNGTKNNPFLSKNPGDFLNSNSKETNLVLWLGFKIVIIYGSYFIYIPYIYIKITHCRSFNPIHIQKPPCHSSVSR
jgi:hypothetical protein